jgi:hypothetical protein
MSNEKNSPTIIVCIDTTNASETALRYACYKAKSTGFTVQILAVMEASHKNLLFGAKAIGNEKRQLLEKHLKKLINSICKETAITPTISVREGDIVTEITRELKFTSDCKMLIFGKSHNSLSDNTVLPRIVQKIGKKIHVPITIVPENLSDEFLQKMV